MIKKLLIVIAAIVGVVYGTGHDFAGIKQSVLGAANHNARGMTAARDDGWGDS